MDFNYSEEQVLLGNSVERLLRDDYSAKDRHAILAGDKGYSSEMWGKLADLGALALTLPETAEGFGGNMVDAMVLGIEFGKALTLEPYLASVILGGGALELAGHYDKLSGVADGSVILAVALNEPGARHDVTHIKTRARASAQGYVFSGDKCLVMGGGTADKVILSARLADTDEPALFIADANAEGLVRLGYRLADGRGAADIQFAEMHVDASALLCRGEDALAVMQAVWDRGAAFAMAECLGAYLRMLEITNAYLKTREQFGRPIGTFQALQHRMADMLIDYEYAKSLVYQAASQADSGDRDARALAISAAKVSLGEASRKRGQDAMQMHGGIGITEEYELGDYVKRMLVCEVLFGDVDHHLERFGRISCT